MADLGYVFATGEGTVGRQSVALARSIERNHPGAAVYVFVPEDERAAMDDDVLDYLGDVGELLPGDIPIPEYPISAKIEALRLAQAAAGEEYLAMLDTDVLVLEPLTVQASGKELYLKPVDVGRQFWGRDVSEEWWADLYREHDGDVPDWRVRSTFDGVEMYPHWNAGFVLTSVDDLGAEWLELAETLHGEIPYDRHADQVALGILSAHRDVEVLDRRYNYPIHLRLRCPEDVVVLHYHRERNLRKVTSRRLREEVAACGIDVEGSLYTDPGLLASSAYRYAKRRTLPLNEEHALERAYNRVRGVLGRS